MRHTVFQYTHALVRALEGKSAQENEQTLERLKNTVQANGDEFLLPTILRNAIRELRRIKNQRTAHIISAIVLVEKEKQMLKQAFASHEYEFEVNKNIVAGLVVKKGSTMWTLTAKRLLDTLHA